jgi:hypothetical protein
MIQGALGTARPEDVKWGGQVYEALKETGPDGLEKLFSGQRKLTDRHVKIIKLISKRLGISLSDEEIAKYTRKSPEKSKIDKFNFKLFQ